MTGSGDTGTIERPGVRTSGQRLKLGKMVRPYLRISTSNSLKSWNLLESGSQVEDNCADEGRSEEREHRSRGGEHCGGGGSTEGVGGGAAPNETDCLIPSVTES